MKMYGYIYITENLINHKLYIGQHRSSKLDEQYKGSGVLLAKAFKKYGKENFKTTILEKCYSDKSLNEREEYWIDYYNAVENDLYYNISRGGRGHKCDPWNKGKHQPLHENSRKGLEIGWHMPASEKLKEKLRNRKELVTYTPEYREKLSKANTKWFNDNPSGKLISPDGKQVRVLVSDAEKYFKLGYTCGKHSKLYKQFKLWSSTTNR